jgi:hypothetical protein
MKEPIILIGVGEMGGVFARGLLRLGHPVFPVNRATPMSDVAEAVPDPALALLAVGEADLAPVLSDLPPSWRGRLGLLQNELLPTDWDGLDRPTIISVWFEKKPGTDFKVIIPSPVFGPGSQLLADALGTLGIPTNVLADEDQLLFELVVKNLYILTSNIAGLRTGGTVGELWSRHRELAQRIGNEVIDLQEAKTGHRFDRNALFGAMARAFEGDPAHKCMGRSAPARLERALEQAAALGLELPTLSGLRSKH